MFDYVCIFTTGGAILWYRAFCGSQEGMLEPLNNFIKSILLEEKSTKTQFNVGDCVLKWKVQNDL